MSGWRASGIWKGMPSILPAEVIGSWHDDPAAGSDCLSHPGEDYRGLVDVEEQEATEGEVDGLG